MSSKILRIKRPYPTVEAFIDEEGWCINRKGMLLVGQEAIETGEVIRFELSLEDGSRLLRAEAKVVEYSEARDDRPAGLKVRFKRFDASAKALIERVVRESVKPPPPRKPSRPAMVSLVDMEGPEPIVDPVASDSSPSATRIVDDAAEEDGRQEDNTGIRHKSVGPIAPPENRAELLEKLRERARRIGDVELKELG